MDKIESFYKTIREAKPGNMAAWQEPGLWIGVGLLSHWASEVGHYYKVRIETGTRETGRTIHQICLPSAEAAINWIKQDETVPAFSSSSSEDKDVGYFTPLRIDENGELYVDSPTTEKVTENKSEPECECGKEKFNFMGHSTWCPIYDQD